LFALPGRCQGGRCSVLFSPPPSLAPRPWCAGTATAVNRSAFSDQRLVCSVTSLAFRVCKDVTYSV
jgi:hypothetical protein